MALRPPWPQIHIFPRISQLFSSKLFPRLFLFEWHVMTPTIGLWVQPWPMTPITSLWDSDNSCWRPPWLPEMQPWDPNMGYCLRRNKGSLIKATKLQFSIHSCSFSVDYCHFSVHYSYNRLMDGITRSINGISWFSRFVPRISRHFLGFLKFSIANRLFK